MNFMSYTPTYLASFLRLPNAVSLVRALTKVQRSATQILKVCAVSLNGEEQGLALKLPANAQDGLSDGQAVRVTAERPSVACFPSGGCIGAVDIVGLTC